MTTIWELDFYSRPIVDENNKKTWEVLICESSLQVDVAPEDLFRYAEYCPNNQVNSAWLAASIERAIAKAGHPPDRVRFFRQAMNNMITKACTDINLAAQPSRRTHSLNQWLIDRLATIYPQEPGYQSGGNPSVAFPKTPPQPMPDALRGEKWSIVSLAAEAFGDMKDWSIEFGEAFPLKGAGVNPDAPIPGLIIYSPRAVPMAAWMSGLELAAITYDTETVPFLVLETGVIDRWVLTPLPNPELQAEASQFEQAKAVANGIHFIALQSDPESEAFAGFWLLREVNLG